MECTRRLFVASLAGIASQGPARAQGEVAIERDLPGKPHAGKVLAAIQPHADDIPIFAGGLVAKLISEGYTRIPDPHDH
jgi:hypothetical protein